MEVTGLQYPPVKTINDEFYFQCTATRIGECAYNKILENRHHGMVHSVFNQAVNIIFSDGGLITILDDKYQSVPFGISVVLDNTFSFKKKLHAGDFAFMDKNRLQLKSVGYEMEVTFPVKVFFPGKQIFSFYKIYNPFITLIPGWVKLHNRNGGFFSLYKKLEYVQEDYNQDFKDVICDYAAIRIKNLYTYLLISDLSKSVESLLQLVGLGNGLTPSGDDFIVGFLAFLNSVSEQIFPENFMKNVRSEMLGAIRNRTTTVSEAYLISALNGRFSEILETFVAGFYSNDLEKMKMKTDNLINVGSSSGIDMILGCLFAVRLYQTKLTKNI
jgi:hypothetical protein